MRKNGIRAWRSECLDGIDIIERAIEKLRDCGDTAGTSQRAFLTQKVNDLVAAICGTTAADLEEAK